MLFGELGAFIIDILDQKGFFYDEPENKSVKGKSTICWLILIIIANINTFTG
ncbi:unnamed protein product [marine sediment metagenome]|uniref:Uncharacterized protein n=1 Tax=marine sediment metagenome TaxID=412755 RepID=X1H1P0_9ZZZZ